jgi:histidyl-tRNA synthetase
MLKELKDQAVFGSHKIANETIGEMELLFQYCEAMGCLENLSFDFSLARGLDYYTGLIYEAVMLEGTQLGSIAGGGRYDTLVGMFSKTPIPAIGVSIGIERMFSMLEEQAKKNQDVRATETQVLVASIGKGMVPHRLKTVNALWAVGIKAETLYNDNPKP